MNKGSPPLPLSPGVLQVAGVPLALLGPEASRLFRLFGVLGGGRG